MDERDSLPARLARYEWFREETLRQIEKDFALSGFPMELPDSLTDWVSVVDHLGRWMESHRLLQHSKLPTLLYQLDLPLDDRVAAAVSPYRALAQLILLRCAEKTHLRHKLS